MQNVTVINKGEERFTGKFNGEAFVIEPGGQLTMPVVAAAFLFGYGRPDADRKAVLVRNGWLRNSFEDDDFGPVAANKRLAAFVFKKAPDDPAPARPKPIVLRAPEPRNAAGPVISLPGQSEPPAPRAAA